MDLERFAAVDTYLEGQFGDHGDPVLDAAQRRADEAALPTIAVSATQGRFLHVLALAVGARSILEIGTLGGYSTIWLARALPPDGRLISLELDPHHAAVARENVAAADLDGVVEVRIGPALDSLQALVDEGAGPFDLVFIDADKPPYTEYLAAALRLSRPGTLLVADNVVRDGAVLDRDSDDPAVRGVRRFIAALAAQPGVTGAVVQQVGAKGYDGMALAVVRELP